MRALLVAVLVAAALVACGEPEPSTPERVAIAADLPRIDGSTSTHPLRTLIVCELVQVPCTWGVMPDGSRRVVPEPDVAIDPIRESVASSGTHGSYVALAEGRADLILTARLPNDEEVALAAAEGIEYEISSIALDAFVFMVNRGNRVQELDLDEIRGIFSGAITNWSEVGGDNRSIQPYQRNETSGSQVLMRELVMGDVRMIEAPDLMLPSMNAPFDAISRDPDGIAYSVYYFATEMLPTDEIRLLRVDGIAANTATIRSDAYPLVTEVYAVLESATPAGDTARLVRDWLLSDEGRQVIAKSGYVPMP